MLQTLTARRTASRPATTVGLLSTAHLINDAYGTVYPALVPYMMVLLHWSVTVSALVGAVGWASQVAQPFLGRFVDARPNRFYTGLALLAGSLAVLAEPFTRNYGLFLALIVVGGLAGSLFHPPSLSVMGQIGGERRGSRMAIFMVAGNVGRAVGPVTTSLLILWAGGHIAGAAWIALPGMLLALGTLVWTPRPADRHPDHDAAGGAIRLLWARAKPVAALLGLSGTRALATSSLVALLPVWERIQGHSALQSSFLLGVLLFVGSFGNGFGGWLSDHWPRRRILVAAALGSGAALLAYVPSHGVLQVLLIGVVGLFAMSTASITMLMGQELFPESRAMASGIALGVGNAFGAVLVALLSVVAGRLGIPTALTLAGVLVLAGSPLAYLYERWAARPSDPVARPA